MIRRVRIKNFKSIASADVSLTPLTIIVGPNGAGKSNFLDSLAFVRESLAESVEMALKTRGGIGAVRRRSGGHPTHFGVDLHVALPDETEARYSFEVAPVPPSRFRVAREECVVSDPKDATRVWRFATRDGEFTEPIQGIRARVAKDRLALFAASATDEFRPLFDFLTSMRFYAIEPQRLRDLQDPDAGDFLDGAGSNAAAVLKRIQDEGDSERYRRLCRLLARVVEGVEQVEYRAVGKKETLQFKQDVGLEKPWTFDPINMSDGTLRVLGLLLAVHQIGPCSVIGLEEPEATVHPAVAEVLMDVFVDAATERQVLLTTHSPDFLDSHRVQADQILSVAMEGDHSVIAPIAEPGRRAIRERLYTAGELLRANELPPDADPEQDGSGQLTLFEPSTPRDGPA